MRISDWSSDVCSSDLAIDEFMRAFAAVMTFRVCVKETQIQGVTIKPGDKVAMSTTLAARDPDEWDRPNEIILNRKPRHVSFGYGPHLCVGMHLAKREMRIAMKKFLTVIPESIGRASCRERVSQS